MKTEDPAMIPERVNLAKESFAPLLILSYYYMKSGISRRVTYTHRKCIKLVSNPLANIGDRPLQPDPASPSSPLL